MVTYRSLPEADFLTLLTTDAVVFPVAPAPFTIAASTMAVQSMIQKSQREMETKNYLEYVQMQLALKNQICQVIDLRHLKALWNPVTNSITRSVLDIISFLKSRFGRVNIMQLSKAETALKVFVYDLTDPIDEAIFQCIDDYI